MKRVTWLAFALLALAVVAVLVASCWAMTVRVSRERLAAAAGATRAVAVSAPSATPTDTARPWTPTPTAIPTATPMASRTATPRQTELATRASSPTPTRTPARVELVLTEAQVNDLAERALAGRSDLPVSGVRIYLERDRVVATGRARLGFFSTDVEVVATIAAKDGKAVPEIVSIRAGGQPLTGFLRAQVEGMLTPYLEQWLRTETGVYVEEVQVEEDRIRILGRYR